MAERSRAAPSRWRRLFWVLAIVHAAGVAGATVWLRGFADAEPLSVLLAYGPRWPAIAPAAVLLLVGLWLRAWRPLALVAVSGLVTWFVYVDFNVPALSSPDAREGDASLRVISLNISANELREPWLGRLLEAQQPDVLGMVECRPPKDFSPPSGYHFATTYDLCLISRHPIVETDARDQEDAFDRHGLAAITRFELEPDAGPAFTVLLVHTMTPRPAIEALVHDRLDGFEAARDNIELRRWEGRLARRWLERAEHPAVVMGDLNLVEESAIYREVWGELDNAFSSCGVGLGRTKHTNKFGVRIDHVLMTERFVCDDAEVVEFRPSDHDALVVDLRLRAR